MKTVFPDYTQCGLNVISSVKKFFGGVVSHPTLKVLDRALPEQVNKIVLMLFDGMGIATLQDFLPVDSFLRSHILTPLTAVFPSTTTNATTCIETACSPKEHSWLGWTLYFEEIDKAVDIFTNRSDGEPAADYSVADRFIPRGDVCGDLNRECGLKTHFISAYADDCKISTLDELFDNALSFCAVPEKQYIYAYWPEPDHSMHEKGVDHADVAEIVRDLDARIADFAARMPEDAVLLVTADHGLLNARHHYLEDHEDVARMLVRPPTVEPRAASFYVKEEYVNEFPDAFYRSYGHSFKLYSQDEFISIFLGPGEEHPKLRRFLGQYIAVATDHDDIDGKRSDFELVGVHAGLTDREMIVPLVFYRNRI